MALLPILFRPPCLRAGLCLAAWPLATFGSIAPAADPPATIIVLDASGSMRERLQRHKKIDIARAVVRELVHGLPDDFRLGLAAYGHRNNDCTDLELLIPPGRIDKAAFIRAVDALRPRGRTPISASLRFSAEALGYRKNHANIVLISDGEETCEADPCDTARLLARDAAGLTIHTVGFNLSAREAEAIECVALATGGRYFAAHDAASLRDALERVIGEIRVIQTAADALSPVLLKAPEKVGASASLQVEWRGPDGPGDYLTLVPAAAPDGVYRAVAYTRRGSPLGVETPTSSGEAELRYVSAASRTVLARLKIEVTAAPVRLSVPAHAPPGEVVAIEWTGPDGPGDFITIVPPSFADGRIAAHAFTARGTTVHVATPATAGPWEVRYISGQGHQVRARATLEMAAPNARE